MTAKVLALILTNHKDIECHPSPTIRSRRSELAEPTRPGQELHGLRSPGAGSEAGTHFPGRADAVRQCLVSG